jgi:hypothetical protein
MNDPQLEIRQLERELIVQEVDRILLKLVKNSAEYAFDGKVIDSMPYARQIVAYLREHLV